MLPSSFRAIGLALLVGSQAFGDEFEPASFASGRLPGLPPLASSGGLPVIELELAPSGIVIDALVLEDAPPFSEAIAASATLWRFHPAKDAGAQVPTRVLVVGVFLPPVLMGGGVPSAETVASPSPEIPYPTATSIPTYPPQALYQGVAMVQVTIEPSGAVSEASMLSEDLGFDDIALEHAGRFRFRPARHDGRNVEAKALILFGFRQPQTRPGRIRR